MRLFNAPECFLGYHRLAMERVAPKFDHLTQLAKTVAVPRLHKPLRVPTFPALERTGILGFTDTGTVSIGSTGSLFMVLVRDPAYPLWISAAFPTNWSMYYNQSIPAAGVGIPANDSVVIVGDSEILNVTGTTPNGIAPLIRFASDDYVPVFSHLGSNIYLGVELQANAAINGVRVEVVLLIQTALGIETRTISRNGTPQVFGQTYGVPFAIAPEVQSAIIGLRVAEVQVNAAGAAANMSALAVGVTTTVPGAAAGDQARCLSVPVGSVVRTGLVPWRFPPAFLESTLPYRGSRANAAAVLLSNVGKVLDKEGTVEGARVAVATFPVFDFTSWQFGNIHPNDRYFGPLEKGCYSFTLADNSSDKMRDCVDSVKSVFNVDGFEYANVLLMADTDTTTPTTLAVTLDRHVEFRSSSPLFTTGYAAETLETYHQAQIALLKMGCVLENPTHLATIANMASQAARAAWPYLRPLAVQAGNKALNATVNWANKKLGSMTQATLQPPQPQKRRRKPKAAKKVAVKKR